MTETSSCCMRGAGDREPVEPAAAFGFAPSAAPVRQHWSDAIGGAFWMGSPEPGRYPADGEGPARQVTLGTFEIACTAVTNAQFGDFVRDTGYTTDAEGFGWSFVFDKLIDDQHRRLALHRAAETPWWLAMPRAYWAQPEGPHSSVLDRLDHPVVHVSWNDAQAYCHWAGARLPSEAEWECAARGGLDRAIFPWGDELTPDGAHRCNVWQGRFPDDNSASDGFVGTAPVQSFAPNGFGLYNVAGNVWEWCEDYFSPDYHRITSATDPLLTAPSASRSLRGGSFLCHDSYCNRYRVAARSSNTPDSSASNVGFRVARDAATRQLR
jgi:formylglycine-generating enzyme required for sulfatase activity